MKKSAQTDVRGASRVAETQRPLRAPAPGGRLAQLAAMVNGGSRVHPVAQLKDESRQSPRVQRLMALAAEIHRGGPAESSEPAVDQNADQGSSTETRGPVAQRQTAQLYTTAGGKKISAGGDYYVKTTDREKLFVKAGATIGARGAQIVATGAAEQYNNATYSAYHYYADNTGGFVNDCLGLAEQLARSTKVPSNQAELRAPGTGGLHGELFGDTDDMNVQIAQDANWYTNTAANPALGEAYAIGATVRPGVGASTATEDPYHVAAVVAKDGTDNITLEADAGDATRSRPLFEIYDSRPPNLRLDPDSKTFHEVYTNRFTYKRKTTAKRKKKRKRSVTKTHPPSTGILR